MPVRRWKIPARNNIKQHSTASNNDNNKKSIDNNEKCVENFVIPSMGLSGIFFISGFNQWAPWPARPIPDDAEGGGYPPEEIAGMTWV